MNPIDHAVQLYKTHDADFDYALNWHLSNGVVVSLPDCFMLAFFCDRNDPRNPLPLGKADCVHVTMCVGDMRLAGLQISKLVPCIAYQRQFKGDARMRVTDFHKFYNKLK